MISIASGSVVSKNCEPNSVCAGVPARKKETFDDDIKKRIKSEQSGEFVTNAHHRKLTEQDIEPLKYGFTQSR